MKTESETYFEQFCHRNGFPLLPVPVTTTKTPDYTLDVGGQLIVVEVKEIGPTPEERESDRVMKATGVGTAISITPGKTVRKKIGDCSPQVKARTQGQHPGLLVLWEGGLCVGRHTEAYHIRVAMAGFEQVILAVPPLGSGLSPSVAGMKHGPGRKMTAGSEDAKGTNTSISAVALLCVPSENKMLLQVFHNRYAAVPLDPTLLTAPEVIHYVLRDYAGRTTEWQPVGLSTTPTQELEPMTVPQKEQTAFRGGKHLLLKQSVRKDTEWNVVEVEGDYDFSSDKLPLGHWFTTYDEALQFFKRRAEELEPSTAG